MIEICVVTNSNLVSYYFQFIQWCCNWIRTWHGRRFSPGKRNVTPPKKHYNNKCIMFIRGLTYLFFFFSFYLYCSCSILSLLFVTRNAVRGTKSVCLVRGSSRWLCVCPRSPGDQSIWHFIRPVKFHAFLMLYFLVYFMHGQQAVLNETRSTEFHAIKHIFWPCMKVLTKRVFISILLSVAI